MRNSKNLPVIRTARDIDSINQAVKAGYLIDLKPANTNATFKTEVHLLHNPATNTYCWGVPDIRYTGIPYEMVGDTCQKLDTVLGPFDAFLPRCQNPFAAYLIPAHLTPGSPVWLEDLIEDLPEFWHYGYERLNSAPGIWTGKTIQVDFNPDTDMAAVLG